MPSSLNNNPATPAIAGTVSDITVHLLKAREEIVNKRNREKETATAPIEPAKLTRRKVLLNMAARLSSSVYRDIPQVKRTAGLEKKLCRVAMHFLSGGMEVAEVAERLEGMVG